MHLLIINPDYTVNTLNAWCAFVSELEIALDADKLPPPFPCSY